jgi:hypothetical protein
MHAALPGRRRGGTALAAAGLALGLAAAAVPWSYQRAARGAPPIHDISTDTGDPPPFVEALPLRRDAPSPAGYGGPEVAAQQAQAYPDLRTETVAQPPEAVARHALAAAEALGWEIVGSDLAQGRIEATDTTFWFGFKDDVVIRIRPDPAGAGSAVDVRSVSRVGRGDAGANAARIRTFLRELRERLSS